MRADAQVLYAARGAGQTGELYTLNPTTGAMIQDVGPLNDVGATNYGMTGIAFSPASGTLFGSTAGNIAATAGNLVTINPANAQVTVVGPFNIGAGVTMTDLAFGPSGQLYGISSVGGANLYTIDVLTGQATQVGPAGPTFTSGGGLAISSAGIFNGTPTTTQYGTYDPTTGVYTNITNPAKPAGGGGYGALAFSGAGVLYGMNLREGAASGHLTHLVTIDGPTGTVTDVGASVPAIDAIAFSPTPVPEPGTFALVATAVVGLWWPKRWRAGRMAPPRA